jgi:hypothetical protein
MLYTVLQEVGKFAFRQGQAGGNRRELELLPFPLGVHVLLDIQFPKDRQIRPRLGLCRSLEDRSVRELVLFAHVAIAEAIDQQLHRGTPGLQQGLEGFGLDLMDGRLRPNGVGDNPEELVNDLV